MTMTALQRTSPGQQGVRGEGVSAFVLAAEERGIALHSLMVARHGAVVAEGWWVPYAHDQRHMMFSVSKSITATAIGIAQDEGLLTVDDHLMDFFPSLGSRENRRNMRDVRVRHLLAMATGHDIDTMEIMRALPNEDWVRIFMGVPIVFPPGSYFLYNSGASYVLSAIVTARTGKSPRDYLRERLWRPLGVVDPPWENSPGGLNLGASGVRLTTEELLKLGLLYLRGGSWEGRQVLSQAWVRDATSAQVSNGADTNDDWAQGYGFQIWRSRHNSYRLDGKYGQFAFVLPSSDAVVAITAGTSASRDIPDLLWKHLLPAFEDEAIEEESEAVDSMRVLLRTRTVNLPPFLPPVWGEAELLSGTIELPFNTLHVTKVRLQLDGEHVVMTLDTAEGRSETHRAHRSSWTPGHTKLWAHEEMQSVATFETAGFTSPTRLEVHQQLTDTPFRRLWTFEYRGVGRVQVRVGLDNGFWMERTEILDAYIRDGSTGQASTPV